jgi:hypothetical protein
MARGTMSRKALLERARSLRLQAEEAGDSYAKEALEIIANSYEILAETATPDDEMPPDAGGVDKSDL